MTLHKRIEDRLKNHKVVVVFLLVTGLVGGLAQFTDASTKLYSLLPDHVCTEKSGTPQPIAMPGRAGWTNDGQDGCFVWNSEPQAGATASWTGECRNGLAWGRGTQKWIDALGKTISTFTGDMRDGRREGHGILVWPSGNRCEGPFVDGKRTGNGTMLFANGTRYEGPFVDGKRTGNGTYITENGVRYEGTLVDGKMASYMTIVQPNGNRYQGQVVDWLPHGRGKAIINSKVRDGDWVKGCFRIKSERAAFGVKLSAC